MDDEMTADMAWGETDGKFLDSDDPHFEEFAGDKDVEELEDKDDWHE